MDCKSYLSQMQENYISFYRSVIRSKRESNEQCFTEIWVKPNVPDGSQIVARPLCVDILQQDGEKPSMHMVAREGIEGGLVGSWEINDTLVRAYPAIWESFPIWCRLQEPDWTPLDSWKKKWMDREVHNPDEDGLNGIVHFISDPMQEGGGYLYEIDFGSAPSDAATELLDVLVKMGASEIELGRSDGSDLPAEIKAELLKPELSLRQLVSIMSRLLLMRKDVERVESRGADGLAFYKKGSPDPQVVNLDNLYRMLQRASVELRTKEIYHQLRVYSELAVPLDAASLSELLVVIKDDRFIEGVKHQTQARLELLAKKWVADLWIVCVWDSVNGMRFATKDDAEKYGMSHEQMFDRAVQNFLAYRRPVEISSHGQIFVARTNDCYDASLLLDDKWLSEMESKVQGPLLACVPSRNFVLFGSAGTITEMRATALRVEAGGDHLISNTILVRKQRSWEPYAGPTLFSKSPLPIAVRRDSAKAQDQIEKPKRAWWRFW